MVAGGFYCPPKSRDAYRSVMPEHKYAEPGVNHRVLIVDDGKIIGETLASMFTTRGYEARVVQSAEHAIEVLAEWQPDLAILDVGPVVRFRVQQAQPL
jgi:PleD family two-component response regulator